MKNVDKIEEMLKKAKADNKATLKAMAAKEKAEKKATEKAVKDIVAAFEKEKDAYEKYLNAAGVQMEKAGIAWNAAREAGVSDKTLSDALKSTGVSAQQVTRVRKAAAIMKVAENETFDVSVRVLMDAADALNAGIPSDDVMKALKSDDARAAVDAIMPQKASEDEKPARKGAATARKGAAVDDAATKAAGYYQVVRDALKAAGVAADNHAYDALASLASLAGMPANFQ